MSKNQDYVLGNDYQNLNQEFKIAGDVKRIITRGN
jgi:hypothetical protein